MKDDASVIPSGASDPNADLPVLVVRFPATYAWMLIVIGGIFLLLGLLFALLNHHRNLGFGVFLSAISLAAIFGGHYWRRHLHVVAQLTPRQLILRRDGTINWEEISAIEKKEIRSTYRGVPGGSDFVCIALKSRRESKRGLENFLLKAKHAVTGYDLIVPVSEMSCTADWFVAECRKRMAAASGSKPPQ